MLLSRLSAVRNQPLRCNLFHFIAIILHFISSPLYSSFHFVPLFSFLHCAVFKELSQSVFWFNRFSSGCYCHSTAFDMYHHSLHKNKILITPSLQHWVWLFWYVCTIEEFLTNKMKSSQHPLFFLQLLSPHHIHCIHLKSKTFLYCFSFVWMETWIIWFDGGNIWKIPLICSVTAFSPCTKLDFSWHLVIFPLVHSLHCNL